MTLEEQIEKLEEVITNEEAHLEAVTAMMKERVDLFKEALESLVKLKGEEK